GADFAARVDAVNLSERHEQQMMVAEPNDFRQGSTLVACGIDPAHFSHRCQRAFRFDDQSGKLHDASAVLQHAKLPGPLKQTPEAARGISQRLSRFDHAMRDFFKSSSLVSRCPSRTPK